MLNDGFKNEKEIAFEVNGKQIKDLNYMYIDMLEKLYGVLNKNDYVYCIVDHNKFKYDIIIKIKNIEKYISIKMGSKNSFHGESIVTFKRFLNSIGINWNVIRKYNHFHYGEEYDEYNNIKYLSAAEFKEKYQFEIDYINSHLNTEIILRKIAERVIFVGTNLSRPRIHGIIVGTKYNFTFLLADEIMEILLFHLNKKSTGVHVSCLFISPFMRNLNNNPNNMRIRHNVQVKWYNLFDDYMLMKMHEVVNNTKL